jgi:serine/threonine protein kinase
MEDRYEIRGKIGQGGLGSVYRGFDTRMNREVAIKRISRNGADCELEEESFRQLLKEAGTLASLQHPNIVTVYDVGADEDGPYVIMELISGKTIDELIEKAPLTWLDFRELAMQTQEALIAAHELDFVHSDIKPSNLMLSWLPSGKFQVKILDFGLATLVKSQNPEDLAAMEAVFGSIHFMPPEQFERKPLDFRSDIYSLGCVYYHSLTGTHPYDGKTGEDVMASHLNHAVTPIQEIRSDIPLWVCDWVMWQINRRPEDRPESVRESLSVFLQNDKNPNPTMSLGTAQAASAPKRPRLIIPGSQGGDLATYPAPTSTAVPLDTTPPSTKPLQPTPPATGPIVTALQTKPSPDPVDSSSVPKTKTAPQPLTPPEGSKPSVHTSSLESSPPPTSAMEPAASQADPGTEIQVPLRQASAVRQPIQVHTEKVVSHLPLPAKKTQGLSNSAKTTLAAVLAILVILLAWFIIDRMGQNADTKLYNEMVALAAKDDVKEVPVNSHKLEILLNSAAAVGQVEGRATVYTALVKAKATDNTDVEARITQFATRKEMLPAVRIALIRDVLRYRKNPAVVAPLIAYAKSTDQNDGAVAAVESIRFMAAEEHIDALIELLRNSKNETFRRATEETITAILRKSPRRQDLANHFAPIYQASEDDAIRHAMLRLCGACGGQKALEVVKGALAGSEVKDKLSAVAALGQWPDESAFAVLADSLAVATDARLREKTLDALIEVVNDGETQPQPTERQEQWSRIRSLAKGRAEQQKVVRGLVSNFTDDWAFKMVEDFSKSEDDLVADLAYKGIDYMKNRKANKGDK